MKGKGKMPLVEALKAYIGEETTRFHMPGHKNGQAFSPEFLKNLVGMDVTEIPGLDNLHQPSGVIMEAQRLAAQAFGADKSYFLVNGSTCGIHAMLMTACPPGKKLLVPRNCHKSVWGAMVLGDIRPIYIKPEYDKMRALVTQVSLDEVRRALDENPDVVGMVLVHPNYYGMCSHILEIEKLLHSKGKILLVDEAHGAHFSFHSALPPSAGQAGADIWVQSAHKTLPAFTQAAYLHCRQGHIDIAELSKILSITQSTSPSYMLMASLDWARNLMVERGSELIEKLIDRLQDIRFRLKNEFGICSLNDAHWKEVAALDSTRLVLNVGNLGITGYMAESVLRNAGVQVEMSDLNHIVVICTVADNEKSFENLIKSCRILSRHTSVPKLKSVLTFTLLDIPKQAMSPREAFYSKKENIPIKESAGRVCASTIGIYPPGIPLYCPGEIIDKQGISQLIDVQVQGGRIFGLTYDGFVSVIK